MYTICSAFTFTYYQRLPPNAFTVIITVLAANSNFLFIIKQKTYDYPLACLCLTYNLDKLALLADVHFRSNCERERTHMLSFMGGAR